MHISTRWVHYFYLLEYSFSSSFFFWVLHVVSLWHHKLTPAWQIFLKTKIDLIFTLFQIRGKWGALERKKLSNSLNTDRDEFKALLYLSCFYWTIIDLNSKKLKIKPSIILCPNQHTKLKMKTISYNNEDTSYNNLQNLFKANISDPK